MVLGWDWGALGPDDRATEFAGIVGARGAWFDRLTMNGVGRAWFGRAGPELAEGLTMNCGRRRWIDRLTMNGGRRKRGRSGDRISANQAAGIGDQVAELTREVYTI